MKKRKKRVRGKVDGYPTKFPTRRSKGKKKQKKSNWLTKQLINLRKVPWFQKEKNWSFFRAPPPLEIFLTFPRPERSEGRGKKKIMHFWGKKAVKTLSIHFEM